MTKREEEAERLRLRKQRCEDLRTIRAGIDPALRPVYRENRAALWMTIDGRRYEVVRSEDPQ